MDSLAGPSNPTTPPMKTPKQLGEMKRRQETNQKFEELAQLIGHQKGEKIKKQETILWEAFDVATKLKGTASMDPYVLGFCAGFERVKDISVSFLTNLGLIKFHLLLPRARQPKVPQMQTKQKEERRMRLHLERERKRRDGLTDAFNALKKFITDNQLWNGNLEKKKIVEVTVDYIRKMQEQTLDSQELDSFKQGKKAGQLIAKSRVFKLFQEESRLQIYRSWLEMIIEFQLNPVSLSAFPVPSPIQFSTLAPMSLPLFVQPALPVPAQDDQENVPPVAKPKFFRPFDV
uniref:BHLH domain-containing protein n=1 Tax=Caenorhabditis tropicalis TaxID=1561998 RepID=A0A1I7V2G0_9PELO